MLKKEVSHSSRIDWREIEKLLKYKIIVLAGPWFYY